jgi:hypothetical protein
LGANLHLWRNNSCPILAPFGPQRQQYSAKQAHALESLPTSVANVRELASIVAVTMTIASCPAVMRAVVVASCL